jgi:hypothetical protein
MRCWDRTSPVMAAVWCSPAALAKVAGVPSVSWYAVTWPLLSPAISHPPLQPRCRYTPSAHAHPRRLERGGGRGWQAPEQQRRDGRRLSRPRRGHAVERPAQDLAVRPAREERAGPIRGHRRRLTPSPTPRHGRQAGSETAVPPSACWQPARTQISSDLAALRPWLPPHTSTPCPFYISHQSRHRAAVAYSSWRRGAAQEGRQRSGRPHRCPTPRCGAASPARRQSRAREQRRRLARAVQREAAAAVAAALVAGVVVELALSNRPSRLEPHLLQEPLEAAHTASTSHVTGGCGWLVGGVAKASERVLTLAKHAPLDGGLVLEVGGAVLRDLERLRGASNGHHRARVAVLRARTHTTREPRHSSPPPPSPPPLLLVRHGVSIACVRARAGGCAEGAGGGQRSPAPHTGP